ncbi:MAG: MATE family efflux transporter [Clostridia bacterium]|nr:MATE family efflux transporter [Clostridia bacterium]
MKIELSESFDTKKLLRFTLPSIVMMIFTSIYGVVDGLFVSHFAGKSAFAALNFIMPFLCILGTPGFMIGAGGSAIIARQLGEGDRKRANRTFSLLVYASLVIGALLAAVGLLTVRPIAELLGATGDMLDGCVRYGRIIVIAVPFFILQMEFQTFFSLAERPTHGLLVTVGSGVTNMVLDALFIGVLSWGLEGAALATAISQAVGGIVPLIYFGRENTTPLKIGRCGLDIKALLNTATNGSSELLSNISMSLVGMLYNVQLMRYAGEDGVSAYGVMMYITMIFIALFIGFSMGTAPIVGYHFGAGNTDELKNLRRRCIRLIIIFSLAMLAFAEAMAYPLSLLFVGYDEALMSLTARGFMIYSVNFLFAGLGIFGSSFFTALSNGLISAVISFFRTVVSQVALVLLLPLLLGVDGIWLSITLSELLSMSLTVFFLFKYKKRYNY